MADFIKVHGNLINVEDIRKVEFISDDIYLGLLPKSSEGEILVDYILFPFATIHLFSGEQIDLSIDLYPPEEDCNEDGWEKLNRAYINKSMRNLEKSIGEITIVTDFEYENI